MIYHNHAATAAVIANKDIQHRTPALQLTTFSTIDTCILLIDDRNRKTFHIQHILYYTP